MRVPVHSDFVQVKLNKLNVQFYLIKDKNDSFCHSHNKSVSSWNGITANNLHIIQIKPKVRALGAQITHMCNVATDIDFISKRK